MHRKNNQRRNKIQEDDIRAKVVLIHKKGDLEDSANYRPIAVLNSEYKILTLAITELISENLADWIIPKEQLAKNVWGMTHGLLWDKACSQSAKISGATNYSIWYDFSKAYDLIPCAVKKTNKRTSSASRSLKFNQEHD